MTKKRLTTKKTNANIAINLRRGSKTVKRSYSESGVVQAGQITLQYNGPPRARRTGFLKILSSCDAKLALLAKGVMALCKENV